MKLHSALLYTTLTVLVITSCDSGPRATPVSSKPERQNKAVEVLPTLDWQYSYKSAIKRAKSESKPVLIYFTPQGDFSKVSAWAVKNTTLQTALENNQSFCEYVSGKFILLNMDIKYNTAGEHKRVFKSEAIFEKLGINKFPAFGLISPDGEPKGIFYPEGDGKNLVAHIQEFLDIEKNINNGITKTTDAEGWYLNLEMAKAMSKQSKKPIFIFFTGSDWCGYCKKIKRNVFADPEFKKFLKENTIKLMCDFPKRSQLSAPVKKQNNKLKKKFAVRGFPTMALMNAKGEKTSVIPNYGVSTKQMIEILKKSITDARKKM